MNRTTPLLLCLAIAPTLGAQESLPPIGLAVEDTARTWCGEFAGDSMAGALAPGRRVTLVFADTAVVPSVAARIRGRRSAQCEAAFPQPRWDGYVAYDLELIESTGTTAAFPPVALVVAHEVTWTRSPDGVVRADLDGDGRLEELRRCLAGEGEHLTVWSERAGAPAARRWHEYYDWGAFVDVTCGPGEDGGHITPG